MTMGDPPTGVVTASRSPSEPPHSGGLAPAGPSRMVRPSRVALLRLRHVRAHDQRQTFVIYRFPRLPVRLERQALLVVGRVRHDRATMLAVLANLLPQQFPYPCRDLAHIDAG